MAKQRHLSRAPIAEAVVDIRASLPQSFEITELSRLPDEVSGNFLAPEPMKGFGGTFEFGKDLEQPRSQAIDKGVVGYSYKSVDSTKVLQLRKDGFTLNRLKPYDDWSNLRDEARQLWNIYLSLAHPESISRIALRYINHLNIPISGDQLNLDEYLISAPQVPNELPQTILSFFIGLFYLILRLAPLQLLTKLLNLCLIQKLPRLFLISTHLYKGISIPRVTIFGTYSKNFMFLRTTFSSLT